MSIVNATLVRCSVSEKVDRGGSRVPPGLCDGDGDGDGDGDKNVANGDNNQNDDSAKVEMSFD